METTMMIAKRSQFSNECYCDCICYETQYILTYTQVDLNLAKEKFLIKKKYEKKNLKTVF